jgi:2-haloalkanoic acid dehalogenase type II
MTAGPALLTFDIFGTVLDWRRGLLEAVRAAGGKLDEAGFERVIDAQAADEKAGFRPYREIVARSLRDVPGLDAAAPEAIGAGCGHWPLYPDSRDALARIRKQAPCVATTNSDRDHGEDVQRQLGYRLDDWVCAEEVRLYKPDPAFWRVVANRRGIDFGPSWWHVSSYGDYDLEVARSLNLTCVYVARPHARPGPADHAVPDLAALADILDRLPRS